MPERSAAVEDLQVLNRALAACLGAEPVDWVAGADVALHDDLVLCGLLGGKDVGKSTLINALAGTRVSADAREVGRGTERPMVYVHVACRDTLHARLAALGWDEPYDVTTHEVASLRTVALVDLPDFDSEFREHLRTVRHVAPVLDRVLWIQTPRKIGDRALAAMFAEVIKDTANVYGVLNKVDELLADGDLDGASGEAAAAAWWRAQGTWAHEMMATAGWCPEAERGFLLAAAWPEAERFAASVAQRWGDPRWERYAVDRDTVAAIGRRAAAELVRLRQAVLGPVSAEAARALKEANQRREIATQARRLRAHYDVPAFCARLALVCDRAYQDEVLAESLGEDYTARVAARLRARLRPVTHLADALLERRVEDWPLLRVAHWPLGWLARAVGRRLGPAAGTEGGVEGAPGDIGGRPLAARVDLARARLLADHAALAERLGLARALPPAETLARRAAAALTAQVPRFEARLLDGLRSRQRRPGLLARAFLWGVLLWFPLVQPILEGTLGLYAESGLWSWAQAGHRIVAAFSAVHLLAGFAVVGLIYGILLAAMYARGLRGLRGALDDPEALGPEGSLADAVDRVLETEVLTPLLNPFTLCQARLTRLDEKLQRLGTGTRCAAPDSADRA